MYCRKCKKELTKDNFFERKGHYTSYCKQCILNELEQDPGNPDLYIPYMKELDIPFVYDDWHKFYQREEIKKKEEQRMCSILPKYISMMKLKGWFGYNFNDSIFLEDCAIRGKYHEIEYRKNLVKDIFLRAGIVNE